MTNQELATVIAVASMTLGAMAVLAAILDTIVKLYKKWRDR
jgi:hypothetical protein